jgi:transcriptional regulator with XRE-family HTH domain
MSFNVRLNIARNILELRKQKGLTQSELGEKLSFSDKTVSKWENGDSTPDIEVLCRIAEFFNVSVDDLTKENALDKSKTLSAKEKKNEFVNHLLMMFLSIIFVLLTATVVFVSFTIIKNIYWWRAFVWALPFCSFIFFSYTKKQLKSRTLRLISLSVVVWTILGAIYIQLLQYNLWPIFLLGVPLQAMILISRFLRK